MAQADVDAVDRSMLPKLVPKRSSCVKKDVLDSSHGLVAGWKYIGLRVCSWRVAACLKVSIFCLMTSFRSSWGG